MPGLWIHLKDNPDFYDGFSLQKGEYYECSLYDASHQEQGKSVWQIRASEPKRKDGIWSTGKLIAVSDEHLYWWLTEGDGRDASRKFYLHFCLTEEALCGKTKKKPNEEFHTDYFRSLDASDLVSLRVSWFKAAPAKDDIAGEVAKLTGAGKRNPLGVETQNGASLTGASLTLSRPLKSSLMKLKGCSNVWPHSNARPWGSQPSAEASQLKKKRPVRGTSRAAGGGAVTGAVRRHALLMMAKSNHYGLARRQAGIPAGRTLPVMVSRDTIGKMTRSATSHRPQVVKERRRPRRSARPIVVPMVSANGSAMTAEAVMTFHPRMGMVRNKRKFFARGPPARPSIFSFRNTQRNDRDASQRGCYERCRTS